MEMYDGEDGEYAGEDDASYDGDVGEYRGDVDAIDDDVNDGDVGEYMGDDDVGEYDGDVGEYFGDVIDANVGDDGEYIGDATPDGEYNAVNDGLDGCNSRISSISSWALVAALAATSINETKLPD